MRRRIIAHRSDLSPRDVIDLDGLRITSPWRTWSDLAAGGSEVDLVVLADALHRVAADYDGWHHADRDHDDDVRRRRASGWRLRQDNSRRDLLEETAWILRIFSSFDVFRAPGPAIERMRMALRLAGAPVG